jgi:hypothetical protein
MANQKQDFIVRWDALAKQLTDGFGQARKAGVEMARMAIVHFDDHNSCVYLQKLYNLMPAGVWKTRFAKWATDHSPLDMSDTENFVRDEGVKDKAGVVIAAPMPFAIEKALNLKNADGQVIDCFDYNPAKPATTFDAEKVYKKVSSTLDAFDTKKNKPDSDYDRACLLRYKVAIDAIHAQIAVEAAQDIAA